MANLIDYLDWRGDIPLSVDPFNEVDNLIMAELSYASFEGLLRNMAEQLPKDAAVAREAAPAKLADAAVAREEAPAKLADAAVPREEVPAVLTDAAVAREETPAVLTAAADAREEVPAVLTGPAVASEEGAAQLPPAVPDLPVSLSIKDFCAGFFVLHSEEELSARDSMHKHLPLMLKKLAASQRFGGLILSDYINIHSRDNDEQMAAIVCHLPDGSSYVAFRGTDNSLVGWKEDFLFSYQPQTNGQRHAAQYLSLIAEKCTEKLRVGGHSKGGNLAIYASAFCQPAARQKICEVYSNDGPGFMEEIIASREYQDIVPRIISFVPEESLFGLLLDSLHHDQVIRSSRKGIMQHDLFSWEVLRNRLVRGKALTEGSLFLDQTFTGWVRSLSESERREFVETVFEVLESTGKETFTELNQGKFKNFTEIARSVLTMDEEKRNKALGTLRVLAKNGKIAFLEQLQAALDKISNESVSS